MDSEADSDELSQFSYLWSSGEWSLHCIHETWIKVVFIFSEGRASLLEIIAIRALVPCLGELSPAEIKNEIGGLPEYTLAECSGMEAHRIEQVARSRGLSVRLEGYSTTRYLPVAGNRTLIIEDDDLASRVYQEMIRRGVPLEEIEVD